MTVKREALLLVAWVVAVDVAFVAAYFLAGIERAPDGLKLAFTGIWTVITLAVVIRGLTRIRGARLGRAGPKSRS
ncbi:MAG TPA: hypothetical protein VFY42_01855 [Gemmatimonadales bacterium]|nr:hypothetical protein [Gemmatimonadales bacterium]